jgi:hypothetical protein
MEAFVNERKVKVNAGIGRWTSVAGLVILVAGLVVSLRSPSLAWVSMLSLLLGFLSSVVGAYYANHWTRTPRADQLLDQALKGISNQYHMYHYLLPVRHVMLGPAGLFLFRTYLHEGPIIYDGKKWRQKLSLSRVLGFSGQDSLADPVRDALYDEKRFRNWLAARMPEEGIPEIASFIVFVRDGAELDVAETPVPVLQAKQLKGTVRRVDRDRADPLQEDELYEVERAMLGPKIDEL